MSITIRTTWTDSISPAATGNKVYRNDIEIQDLGMGVEVWDDATAEYDIQYKYEVQAYSIDDETVQEVDNVNVFHILIPTPSITKLVTITTDSVSATWTPNTIVNTGNTLVWEVTGGVIIGEVTNNNPIFDLSGNTGIATINIKSTSSFVGFTDFRIDSLDILTTDVLEATELTVFSCKLNSAYSSVDVSTLTVLDNLTIRSNNLTSLDITNNTILTYLYCYSNFITTLDLSTNTELTLIYAYTNNLSSVELDQIVIDLNNHGKSNGTLKIMGNSGNLTTDSYTAYQSLINKGWDIDVLSPEQPSYTELAPILSNFIVNDTNSDRVYFTSSEYITGTTSIGFTIDGVTISNLTIIPNSFTGHYFTLSTALTYFDNNTIRYSNGSDIVDLNDQNLYSFEPIDISNTISEPIISDHTFYTDGSVALSGDGLSEVNAFKTVQEGLDAIDAEGTPEGSTLWVKAYNYGNIINTFIGSGTAIKPIKILGYKTTVGDNPTLIRSIGLSFSATEMPLLSGAIASITSSGDYVIFKNIQIDNSSITDTLFSVDTSNYNVIENCYVDGGQFGFWAYSTTNGTTRIINSYSANASESNVTVRNNNNLIDDVWSVSSVTASDTNNYIAVFGGETGYSNIVKDCFIDRIFDNTHVGVGIMFKNGLTASTSLTYSLIQNNTINKVNQSIVFTYFETQNCISRSNQLIGTGDRANTGGLVCSDGAKNNMHDSNFIFDANIGICMKHDGEDTSTPTVCADNNIFKNNVFDDINIGIVVEDEDATNNKMHNCTFNDCDSLSVVDTVTYPNTSLGVSNVSINSIVTNSGTRDTDDNMDWTYSCFYNNAFTIPIGTGNVNTDPIYVDEANNNFRISSLSPTAVTQGGTITSAIYDKDSNERLSPYSIGAYEYNVVINNAVPVLSNFKVEDTNKDRVYFDSSGDITELTVTGFIISNKTILSLSVNSSFNTGHYFTVSGDLDYFNNNTIRLESGNGIVYDFTLQHISNNITEPANTAQPFYVDGSVASSGTGDSEVQAFKTINEAKDALTSIRRDVYVKSFNGVYDELVTLYNMTPFGTATAPIKITGYKTTPGDLDGIQFYQYSDGAFTYLDAPTVNKTGGAGGFTYDSGHGYIILRNFQAENCGVSYYVSSENGCIIDNCHSRDSSNSGMYIIGGSEDCRVLNSTSIQADLHAVAIAGDYNYVYNTKTYGYTTTNQQDYYFSISGSNNIFINNHSERDIDGGNVWEHGFSLASYYLKYSEHNLIENHLSIGMGKGLELRRGNVAYNVVRRYEFHENIYGNGSHGIEVRDGAHHNTIENSYIHDCVNGIAWVAGSEQISPGGDPQGSKQGTYNIIKNNIFKNLTNVNASQTLVGWVYGVENNEWLNNTYYNISGDVFDIDPNGHATFSNNIAKNNIIDTVGSQGVSTGITYDYNNIWNSWSTTIGINSINVDPEYLDTIDFVSRNVELKVGISLTNVKYDRNNIEREDPSTIGSSELILITGSSPIIYNFRIEDSNKDRIYFDSTEVITGTAVTGFYLGDGNSRTIDFITIITDALIGHYFTVNSAFDFWSNDAIRYAGGSNIIDINSNGVYDFTLTHITNNIIQPSSTTKTIYVWKDATGTGDGTSEVNAFLNLDDALDDAGFSTGVKIWVKASTTAYSQPGQTNAMAQGSITAPNVIEGYKTTIGDLERVSYYQYVINGTLNALDPTEMPMFDGGNREGTINFRDLRSENYTIWKNIQVTGYRRGFYTNDDGFDGFVAENILMKDIGATTIDANGKGFQFESAAQDSDYIRYDNCTVINASSYAFGFRGDYSLAIDCKAYCNEALNSTDVIATTDYYYISEGNNNIYYNCLAYKDTPDGWGHNGHGFSLKTKDTTYGVEYNLVDNCTAIGIQGSFQARHIGCKYNVFKNSEAHSDIINKKVLTDYEKQGGIEFISGGSFNIFEKLYIHDCNLGISFMANNETDKDINAQHNAIIRSCVFKNLDAFIMLDSDQTGTLTPTGNKIYNNTISNCDDFIWQPARSNATTLNDTSFKNNIIDNVTAQFKDVTVGAGTYDYTNIYNSWATSIGTNSLNKDSQFIPNSFIPTEKLLITATPLTDVLYDKDKVERIIPDTIGAYRIRTRPVLSNFHIQNSYPNRVYFDSSDTIGNLSIQGFIVSGKTINSIYVNQYQLIGHYFTVTVAFDFWDNNTVRLEGGNGIVYDFALENIINNIVEPTTTNTVWVDINASGSNNGTSETNAYTVIMDAVDNLTTGGTLINVKAGNYGTQDVTLWEMPITAIATEPVILQGYKTIPGDITSMYYSYGDGALTASEMPLFDTNLAAQGIVITSGKNYCIIRNFQAQSRNNAFYNNGVTGFIVDNCIAKDSEGSGGNGINMVGDNQRALNSIVLNNERHNVLVNGDSNRIDNVKSYCNGDLVDITDYYFVMRGVNNVARNMLAHRDGDLNHSGHGFSLDTNSTITDADDTGITEYNLVENLISINNAKGIEFRHGGVKYNVARNVTSYGEGPGAAVTGGIMFRDGASYNIAENCDIESGASSGDIWFIETDEVHVGLGSYNTVRNSLLHGSNRCIIIQNSNIYATGVENKIYNNTFYGQSTFIRNDDNAIAVSIDCEITNNIITNVTDFEYGVGDADGWTFDHNNFYNGFTVQGTNTSILNPDFIDTINFIPQETGLKRGIKLLEIIYDKEEIERDNTPTLGAQEI